MVVFGLCSDMLMLLMLLFYDLFVIVIDFWVCKVDNENKLKCFFIYRKFVLLDEFCF